MIIRPKKYIQILCISFSLVLGLRLIVSALADPFADFYYLTGWHLGHFHSVENLTERKVKRRLLKDRPVIDIAIFGNSRAAALNPDNSDFAQIGSRALNLSFAGASLSEIQQLLDLSLKKHPRMRPVVVVDYDSCFHPIMPDKPGLFISEQRDQDALKDLMARMLALRTLGDWARALIANTQLHQTILDNGAVLRSNSDTDRQARTLRDLPVMEFVFSQPYKTACLDRIRAIHDRAQNSIFVVNPISPTMVRIMAKYGAEQHLEEWRKNLEALVPVIDFSCIDKWHDSDFVDAHHYNQATAELIMSKIALFLTGKETNSACPNTHF